MTASVAIRAAERGDVALLFGLIVELAEYERAAEQVLATEELLDTALFGTEPVAEAVIAELNGEVAGFALFYPTFSTWLCRPGIWLEDLYVSPQHRRARIGQALLSHVARIAVRRGCGRMEWSALDWNTPALRFYEKLGAKTFSEWHMHRLVGGALVRVAEISGS